MQQAEESRPEISDEPWGSFGSVYLSFIASHLDSHAGGGVREGGKEGDAIKNNNHPRPEKKKRKKKSQPSYEYLANVIYPHSFFVFHVS